MPSRNNHISHQPKCIISSPASRLFKNQDLPFLIQRLISHPRVAGVFGTPRIIISMLPADMTPARRWITDSIFVLLTYQIQSLHAFTLGASGCDKREQNLRAVADRRKSCAIELTKDVRSCFKALNSRQIARKDLQVEVFVTFLPAHNTF